MTQTPHTPPGSGAEAAKVAELEKKLADAAAEVAKVQAELSQARAADPDIPSVPVPYGGQAPVVMINGQQVPGGQAVDISAMLGSAFAGAAGVTATADGGTQIAVPPVVSVNGQVVSGGQPVDLSTYVGPEVAAQIRASLGQLGLTGMLGNLFGTAAGTPSGAVGSSPAAAHPAMMAGGSPGEVSSSGGRLIAIVGVALAVLLVAVLVYLLVQGDL